MTASARSIFSPFKSWFFGAIGLAGVVLIGAAYNLRGPNVQGPQMAEHPVVFPDGSAIFVQKYEVTVSEWNACHAAGACDLALRAPKGHSDLTTPATGLAHTDVSQYIAWINTAMRKGFRLPTLQEWEYMAAEVMPDEPDPIFTDPALSWASAYLLEPQTKRTLRPQGSFSTTAEGIVDLNGSVWEWTDECYAGAAISEITKDRCPAFFVGGDHIAAVPFLVRDPARGGCAVGVPPAHLGMRLVSDRRG